MPVRNTLIKAILFILGICVGSSIIYYGIYPFVMYYMQQITAISASFVLNILGIHSTATFGDIPIVTANMFNAQIVPLCVGDIELAILVSAILFTMDRTLRQRAIGVFLSIIFVFVVNALRIALTLAGGVWFGFNAMVFLHTFLFRLVLVLSIVFFYAAWYLFPSGFATLIPNYP
ncbi:MAG: exosortase/archaeosortase family protein [Candidatus Diapherotrites archaeon]|nr:exosortase/archaeosortase family protein [Candidatus Diapherotrites archaeon]